MSVKDPSGRYTPEHHRQRSDKRHKALQPGTGKHKRPAEDDTWQPRANTDHTKPPSRAPEQTPLARRLAEAGLGTRRKIALWLENGRLLVNGQPALPGAQIPHITSLCLDGKTIRMPSPDSSNHLLRIIAYHKAIGEICSRHDPHGRPLAYKRLPPIKGRRWINVGRLDCMTGGLLLFTNNGELAYRLMHPSYQLERVYVARVYGRPVNEALIQELLNGVLLDDGPACFTRIDRMHKPDGKNTWLRVTLTEGRNREVRRIFQTVGLKTNHLLRVQYGPHHLSLQSRPGNWHELTRDEKKQLTDCTGITNRNDSSP